MAVGEITTEECGDKNLLGLIAEVPNSACVNLQTIPCIIICHFDTKKCLL